MHFTSLEINNLGVFGKTTKFILNNINNKNISIIYGRNGSGKSTIFKAFGLTLYGKLSFVNKLTQNQYERYIINRLHKNNKGVHERHAHVALELDFSISGVKKRIYLKREWKIINESLKENLIIFIDGQKPEFNEDDNQDWINSLINPGTIQSVFFDAEELDNFANPEKHNEQLKFTLDRLFGLDLIAKLQTDLFAFMLNNNETTMLKTYKEEYKETEITVSKLEKKIEILNFEIEKFTLEKEAFSKQFNECQRRFAEIGGNIALRRPEIESKIFENDNQIKKIRNEIKSFCSDTFPLSLAPKISESLIRQLSKEQKTNRSKYIKEFLLEKHNDINLKIKTIQKTIFRSNKEEDIRSFIDGLFNLLYGEVNTTIDENNLIHDLSESDINLYTSWIKKSQITDAPTIHKLCNTLKSHEQIGASLAYELEQAPDEDLVKAHDEEKNVILFKLREIEEKIDFTKKSVLNIQAEIEILEQHKRVIVNNLSNLFIEERKTDLAHHAQAALSTYKELLRKSKLIELESTFIEIFNKLSIKNQLIKNIFVITDNFSTIIEDINGNILSIDQLSAAERQLYVYSLVCGIHKSSGLPLPLIIDTPLARFDHKHRGRLVKDYFPVVSDQVILFATDEEEKSFREHGGYKFIANSYKLNYDENNSETSVLNSFHSEEAFCNVS